MFTKQSASDDIILHYTHMLVNIITIIQ